MVVGKQATMFLASASVGTRHWGVGDERHTLARLVDDVARSELRSGAVRRATRDEHLLQSTITASAERDPEPFVHAFASADFD